MNLLSTLTITLLLSTVSGACRSTDPYGTAESLPEDTAPVDPSNTCQAAKQNPDAPLAHTVNTLIRTMAAADCEAMMVRLAQVHHLDLTGRSLSDLGPLQYARSLESLDISNNRVRDLAPLVYLSTLKRLYVSRNNLRFLPPMHEWNRLTELNVAANKITDISPVMTMTALESLDLSMNQIRSAEALENVPSLRVLYADDNIISDVSPLARNLKLEQLHMAKNAVLDLRPLADLAALRHVSYLDLSDNPISRSGCPLNGESEAITTFCQNTFVDRN